MKFFNIIVEFTESFNRKIDKYKNTKNSVLNQEDNHLKFFNVIVQFNESFNKFQELFVENNINNQQDKITHYLQSHLGYLILNQYKEQYILFSNLSIKISDEIISPSLAIYSIKDKLHLLNSSEKIEILPLGIIEILSSNQSTSQFKQKIQCYLNAGIQSAWLIIPEFKTIYIYNHNINHQKNYDISQKLFDDVLKIELNLTDIFN